MSIIRPNASKETLWYEIRELKEEIHNYEVLSRKTQRTALKHQHYADKCKIRLIEMEKRFKSK
jgi:hypothetical protein